MNFSIHIDQSLERDLAGLVKKSKKTRNALINEALRFFIGYQKHAKWPRSVLKLAGAARNMEPFESSRRDLTTTNDDPLA